MSPTSPWATLLPAALAGTRRQPVAPLPGLTPNLGAEADAPEKALLLTVANLRLVQLAGQRPVSSSAEAPPRHAPTPAERAAEWPALGPVAGQHLKSLLAEDGRYINDLWQSGLALLHGQRRRLPHRLILQVLAALARLNKAEFLSTYAPVFGGQGAWLAAAFPHESIRGQATDAAAALRLHAPLAQRLGALTELCASAPEQAWQYVATALPVVAPPTQLALLSWVILRLPSGPVFTGLVPLLEPLAAATTTEPVAQQLARRAQYILKRLPDSAWAQRQWQRASGYLTLERFPHEPPRLHVQLPTDAEIDKTWHQDGIGPSEAATETERGWQLLLELLASIAPSRWFAAWGIPADEAVALLAAAPRADNLLAAWLAAARTLHDTGAAHALLSCLAHHQHTVKELNYAVRVLPPAKQAAWWRSVLPTLPTTIAPMVPGRGLVLPAWVEWVSSMGHSAEGPPLEVTQVLLPFLRDCLLHDTSTYQWPADNLSQLLGDIAVNGPPGVLAWYEAELPLLAATHPRFAPVIEQALRRLRIRQGLATSSQEPPGPDR